MELMNKDLLRLTRDLELNQAAAFKQDSRLVMAIDKLYRGNQICLDVKSDNGLLLPGRKLEFGEVQRMLKDATKSNVSEKSPALSLQEINDARKILIAKVESILGEINTCAEAGDTPKLTIRNQRLWSNCIYDFDRVTLKAFNYAKKTTITYNSNEDKTRFNAIVFVLAKVHELLTKNFTVNRRELFYQNVTRLRNQANLDVAVRDVCCLLETPPWNLGIVATAKGLIAGPLTIQMRDGNVIDCMTSGGTLIPQDVNGIREFKSTAKYILVVEKDAVFQKLLDEGALIRLAPVIIITGKGYPDVGTRKLLCRLTSELRLRALALVDADPHGFEIFLTYKYGSLAQSHLASSLACSSLQLLGGRHRDVMTLAPPETRLALTEIDKRKLKNLLKRPYLESGIGSKIKEELRAMLASGVKAEIEAVAPTAAALCDAYLPSKIIQADFLDITMDEPESLDKRNIPKTKSHNSTPPLKVKNDAAKHKSDVVNDAVKSLDLALGRLKKSKFVNGELRAMSGPAVVVRRAGRGAPSAEISTDTSCCGSSINPAIDSASVMSLNFSHYELMRNLSCTNSASESTFSGATDGQMDPALKREHIEKFFRSAELWSRRHARCGQSADSVHFELDEQ